MKTQVTETVTTALSTAGKITTWFIGFPTHFATAYDAAIRFTEKTARHRAVESNPKAARKAQRIFAGFFNRLIKLVLREFPGCEVKIAGDSNSPQMNRLIGSTSSRYCFGITVWMCDGDKINRCFRVQGEGYGYETVMVEQTIYPHPNCNADLGKTEIKTVTKQTAAPGARLIIATPSQAYLAAK